MTQKRDWIDLLERREREAEAREALPFEGLEVGGRDGHRSIDLGASLARARRASGLSLEVLAERIGCSPLKLRRLEESPDEGHSLAMLQRIAAALAMDLAVSFKPRSSSSGSLELPSA